MYNKSGLQKIFIICIICLAYCFGLVSCKNKNTEYKPEIYTPVNMDTNKQNNHCVINDKSYINFGVLSDDGKIEFISENTRQKKTKDDLVVQDMKTDGKNLYYLVREYRFKDDGQIERKIAIYKTNGEIDDIILLTEWDVPQIDRNVLRIQLFGDYIYFFKDNTNGSNDICRIKKDGTGFEKLTDNSGSIYNGVFITDDRLFYQKDQNLYKTTLYNIENGELFCENVYTNEFYNGYFYYTNNIDGTLLKLDPKKPNSAEIIITDLLASYYIIKYDIIYYIRHDPIEIGISPTAKLPVYNASQGQICSYNITTGENKLHFQNKDIHYFALLNINQDSILAMAYTNEQLINTEGVTDQYYIIPLDGSEPYLLENPTQNY